MGHLMNGVKPFSEEVCEMGKHIIQGALELHQGVGQNFRKSAVNFHYEFNIRHLSNVFQGRQQEDGAERQGKRGREEMKRKGECAVSLYVVRILKY